MKYLIHLELESDYDTDVVESLCRTGMVRHGVHPVKLLVAVPEPAAQQESDVDEILVARIGHIFSEPNMTWTGKIFALRETLRSRPVRRISWQAAEASAQGTAKVETEGK